MGAAQLLLQIVTLAHVLQVLVLQTFLHFLKLADRCLMTLHLVQDVLQLRNARRFFYLLEGGFYFGFFVWIHWLRCLVERLCAQGHILLLAWARLGFQGGLFEHAQILLCLSVRLLRFF